MQVLFRWHPILNANSMFTPQENLVQYESNWERKSM
jgi:hypothetical protein